MLIHKYLYIHIDGYFHALLLAKVLLKNILPEKNMHVGTEWINYTRFSGRASAPKSVMLQIKTAISCIKQSLPRNSETTKWSPWKSRKEKQKDPLQGRDLERGRGWTRQVCVPFLVQAEQCCLPWAPLGCSPEDEVVGTPRAGSPRAGVSHICHMGCKGTLAGLRGDGEAAAYMSSKGKWKWGRYGKGSK